jgi:hypothetical protein
MTETAYGDTMMLIERMTFVARYGKGDALLDSLREFNRLFGARLGSPGRVATDRTGRMFRIVWDIDHADLAAWAASTATEREIFGTPEFAEWFAKMEPLVESGDRELFEAVDL